MANNFENRPQVTIFLNSTTEISKFYFMIGIDLSLSAFQGVTFFFAFSPQISLLPENSKCPLQCPTTTEQFSSVLDQHFEIKIHLGSKIVNEKEQ